MIRKLVNITICLLLTTAPARAEESIVAVVDDTAISSSDLKDRTKLIMLSAGLPNTQEMQEKLKAQILNSLIEEAIQNNEAKKLNILVDKQAVENGIDQIAKQNNVDPKQFRNMLSSKGVNLDTLRKQISSQIAWSNVIQSKIRPRIIITDTDIEATMNQIRGNIGKSEYLAAEIFLPYQDKKQKAKVQQLANRLVSQIRQGKAPFSKVAQQFSGSAGASRGGDLGWVQEGQLPQAIDNTIAKIGKGNISNPIKTDNGVHIIFVRDVRKISETTIPDSEEIHTQIGMERMQKQARGYLIDLKSSAYIERRL